MAAGEWVRAGVADRVGAVTLAAMRLTGGVTVLTVDAAEPTRFPTVFVTVAAVELAVEVAERVTLPTVVVTVEVVELTVDEAERVTLPAVVVTGCVTELTVEVAEPVTVLTVDVAGFVTVLAADVVDPVVLLTVEVTDPVAAAALRATGAVTVVTGGDTGGLTSPAAAAWLEKSTTAPSAPRRSAVASMPSRRSLLAPCLCITLLPGSWSQDPCGSSKAIATDRMLGYLGLFRQSIWSPLDAISMPKLCVGDAGHSFETVLWWLAPVTEIAVLTM